MQIAPGNPWRRCACARSCEQNCHGAPGIAAFRERLDTWWLLAESPECPLGSLTLRLGLYLFEPMERREALLRHENNFLMSIPWTELLSTHWPVFAFVGTLAAQARDRDARGIVCSIPLDETNAALFAQVYGGQPIDFAASMSAAIRVPLPDAPSTPQCALGTVVDRLAYASMFL